jgi:hypothetical protein
LCPGAVATGRVIEPSARAFRRSTGIDGQRMDAGGHHRAQGIINEAVSGHPAQALEALAADEDPEVAALSSALVAGVQVAVVTHGQLERVQGTAQGLLDLLRRDAGRRERVRRHAVLS